MFAAGQYRKLVKQYEAKARELPSKMGEPTIERDSFSARTPVAEPGGPDPGNRPGQRDEPHEWTCSVMTIATQWGRSVFLSSQGIELVTERNERASHFRILCRVAAGETSC